jgi:hypothetical protein
MKSPVIEMIETLEAVRQLVAMSDNSPWSSRVPASLDKLLEKDIACLRKRGDLRWFARRRLKSLFAPTGDLQEISMSAGWSEEFLVLSSRFDLAVNNL